MTPLRYPRLHTRLLYWLRDLITRRGEMSVYLLMREPLTSDDSARVVGVYASHEQAERERARLTDALDSYDKSEIYYEVGKWNVQ
jgi:hypothetical protein